MGGLDQAFQYIQEYSGYIYPGVVVVFGMALIWKRATNKAALWTAIATIPAGVAMKLAFPEAGFLIRMGYVFMFLVVLAVTISLLDKKHAVSDEETMAQKRSQKRGARVMFALSAICFVLGALYSGKYAHLAFEAIFVMAFMMLFVGVILLTNATSKLRDRKAYDYHPSLFRMTPGLTLSAIGIVVILGVLYAIFW